jgi:proteasome lid subunit RPN8/RPN11
MITISPEARRVVEQHARETYPLECCGLLVGRLADDGTRIVVEAKPVPNVAPGDQSRAYRVDELDILRTGRAVSSRGLDVVGIYHSHPDEDSYFSAKDLAESSSWYSFVVLSVRSGEISAARAFRPNLEKTEAPEEELVYGEDTHPNTAAAVRR